MTSSQCQCSWSMSGWHRHSVKEEQTLNSWQPFRRDWTTPSSSNYSFSSSSFYFSNHIFRNITLVESMKSWDRHDFPATIDTVPLPHRNQTAWPKSEDRLTLGCLARESPCGIASPEPRSGPMHNTALPKGPIEPGHIWTQGCSIPFTTTSLYTCDYALAQCSFYQFCSPHFLKLASLSVFNQLYVRILSRLQAEH
jgi:hypothetical protein